MPRRRPQRVVFSPVLSLFRGGRHEWSHQGHLPGTCWQGHGEARAEMFVAPATWQQCCLKTDYEPDHHFRSCTEACDTATLEHPSVHGCLMTGLICPHARKTHEILSTGGERVAGNVTSQCLMTPFNLDAFPRLCWNPLHLMTSVVCVMGLLQLRRPRRDPKPIIPDLIIMYSCS